MRIKGMIMLWMLLLGVAQSVLAQVDSTVYFQGEWEIEKAELKIYNQKDMQLLEQRTVTTPEQLQVLQPRVLLGLIVTGNISTMRYNFMQEVCTLNVIGGKLLLHTENQEIAMSYRFNGALLLVDLPVSFYKDMQRNQPVKQYITCQFHKKP